MRKIARLFFTFIIMLLFSFSINILIISGETIIYNISPEDGARLDSNPLLIINVSNYHPMNIIWYFKEAESAEWEKIGTNLSVMSGVYIQEIPNGTKEGTNYQWRINISDDNDYLNRTYSFRRRGWQTVATVTVRWFIGGNESDIIFPPPEGNGVIYLNESDLISNFSNNVIISMDLITTPKIGGKIFDLGYYLIEGEKIVAINFSAHRWNEKINFSQVFFNLISPEEKIVMTQKLNLNETITRLDSPVIINSSGLWKIKITFLLKNNSENFQVWEKLPSVYAINNKDCISFSLNNDLNLSFQNHYEKVLPIFSLSEVISFQQMSIFEEQGRYLNNTANSLNDTANYLKNVSSDVKNYVKGSELSMWAAWTVAVIAIIGIGVTFFNEWRRESNRIKKLFSGLYSEIIENLKTIEDFKEEGKPIHIRPGVSFLDLNCYLNILASGELHLKLKDKKLLDILHSSYKTIKFYNSQGEFPRARLKKLKNELSKLKKNLPKKLKYLNG